MRQAGWVTSLVTQEDTTTPAEQNRLTRSTLAAIETPPKSTWLLTALCSLFYWHYQGKAVAVECFSSSLKPEVQRQRFLISDPNCSQSMGAFIIAAPAEQLSYKLTLPEDLGTCSGFKRRILPFL